MADPLRLPLLLIEGAVLRSDEGKEIFSQLHWSLPHGAKVRIQGASESGATALLRMAAGLTHPQKGRVILDGVPLGPYTFDHPFLRRGALGWVPTEGGLLVNQSLLANVALPLMFTKGMSRTAAENMAAEALDQAGLSDLANHRPHVLDPRERWLGALVRAFVMEPELWLVDQIPGVLDRRMQDSAISILDRVAASSATVVIVGDELWTPRTQAQAIRLENGRLTYEDTDAIRA